MTSKVFLLNFNCLHQMQKSANFKRRIKDIGKLLILNLNTRLAELARLYKIDRRLIRQWAKPLKKLS